MKKINVIDLDNTLIPYDSFRMYVIEQIKSGDIILIFLTLLRKVKFISSADYKKKVILYKQLKINIVDINNIVSKILNSLNQDILEMINKNTDDRTINILCSASPDVYVKKVAENFSWIGYGSFLQGKEFYHMWGENKLKFIERKYPSSKYTYNFAISDSKTDIELLERFKKMVLYK